MTVECWLRLLEVVETMEVPVAGTVKILRGHKSWPTCVEVACILVVGEEDM